MRTVQAPAACMRWRTLVARRRPGIDDLCLELLHEHDRLHEIGKQDDAAATFGAGCGGGFRRHWERGQWWCRPQFCGALRDEEALRGKTCMPSPLPAKRMRAVPQRRGHATALP